MLCEGLTKAWELCINMDVYPGREGKLGGERYLTRDQGCAVDASYYIYSKMQVAKHLFCDVYIRPRKKNVVLPSATDPIQK